MLNKIQDNKLKTTDDIKEKIVDAAIFMYLFGMSCFKSASAFDAFMCRATFIVMLIAVFFYDKKECKRSCYCLKYYSVFFLFYFISFLWGDIEFGLYYINNIVEILGNCYVFGKMIDSKERLLKYLNFILISIVGMIVLIMIRNDFSNYSQLRSFNGTGLNINEIGFRCCIGMLISFLFLPTNKYYILVSILTALYSLLSGSKKAFIFICGSFFSYVVLYFRGAKRFFSIVLSLFAVLIIIYLTFNIPVLYELMGRRINRFYMTAFSDSRYYSDAGNLIVDSSYEYRLYFKKEAMRLFCENPFFGCGANGFSKEIAKTFDIATYSHCNYTELLSTLGLLGLLLYYIPQLKVLIYGFKELKKKDNIIIFGMIVLVFTLILDYESVSYIAVFKCLMITMISEYVINTYSAKVNTPPSISFDGIECNNGEQEQSSSLC